MKKLSIFLLILLCLCGCAAEVEDPPAPAAEPVITEEPISEPEPIPEPEPEVLPEAAPGMAATVDGQRLPSGTVYLDGTPYLKLEELLTVLDSEYTDPCFFRWKHLAVSMYPDSTRVVLTRQHEVLTLSAPILQVKGTLYMPLELCELLGMSLYEDTRQQLLYITSESGGFPIPEGYTVPTLMYHAVSDDMWGFPELFVSPSEMEAQLQYLTENGFTTIHFSDLPYVDQIEKPVLLTFDDGYLDNYTELFPLLQKYNCKATVFVITGSIGVNEHYMTWEQAKEMADSGLVSIQSHTVNHPELDTRTMNEQANELAQSKLDILYNIGREPYVLCYPTGRYNVDTLTLMKDRYDFGLKMVGGDYITGQNPFEVNRWYVPRGLDFGTFVDMVQ